MLINLTLTLLTNLDLFFSTDQQDILTKLTIMNINHTGLYKKKEKFYAFSDTTVLPYHLNK